MNLKTVSEEHWGKIAEKIPEDPRKGTAGMALDH
jgi:hypothetical protein